MVALGEFGVLGLRRENEGGHVPVLAGDTDAGRLRLLDNFKACPGLLASADELRLGIAQHIDAEVAAGGLE